MTTRKNPKQPPVHPKDALLRVERIPHIWCPGCGIGTVFGAVMAAIQKSGHDLDQLAMVSGIGCTGRMAGYIRLDSFHTTHGRAIPFATGLKLARPETKVLVVSGDGDLLAIGGNHFIHAARRNIDLTVLCVNNLNYGMTGGQQAPSTPFGAKTTTSVAGSPEEGALGPGLAGSGVTAGSVAAAVARGEGEGGAGDRDGAGEPTGGEASSPDAVGDWAGSLDGTDDDPGAGVVTGGARFIATA